MLKPIKGLIRKILVALRLGITKNISYDILTLDILKSLLKKDSLCIDIGAHKGEILQEFFRYAPEARHIAFEPIPALYTSLRTQFGERSEIYPFALSDTAGSSTFNIVLDDPAYSGLRERSYKTSNPRIEKIQVEMARLDDVLKNRTKKIALIKIDVEGGEMGVLKGAGEILANDHPILIFEFGKGAGDYYGTSPEALHSYLTSFSYEIRTLKGFRKKTESLNQDELREIFDSGSDYYFIASNQVRG